MAAGIAGELSAKERLGQGPQDEVILQLENELAELRNACAWKDQRISELSRTDPAPARLKRDIRQLAAELHQTRRQLSESLGEAEARDGAGAAKGRESVDSASTGAGGDAAASGAAERRAADLSAKVGELQEENRQLREALSQLKERAESASHSRQLSGASTQRAPEAHAAQTQPAAQQPAAAGYPGAARQQYPVAVQQVANHHHAGLPGGAASEEPLRPIVYSSFQHENTATIGPTVLQGIGTVDGVASVAKILLQRIHSSVCSAHRRQAQPPAMSTAGQIHHGQQLMVGMPMG